MKSHIDYFFGKSDDEAADLAVGFLFYECGIPFNVLRSEAWRTMMEKVRAASTGWKWPSYNTVRGPLLDKAERVVANLMREGGFDDAMALFGITLQSDGWENTNRVPLTGFMASTPKGSKFVVTVDSSRHVKSAEYLMSEALKIVYILGPENVTAFVTDSASNAKGSCELLQSQEGCEHICPLACQAHVADLLLEDIGKMDWAAGPIAESKQVIKYVRSHHWTIALLRESSRFKLELLYPGETRFATFIIMMRRLVEKKEDLQKTVQTQKWQRQLPGAIVQRTTAQKKTARDTRGAGELSGRVVKPPAKYQTERAIQAAAPKESEKARQARQAKEVHDLVMDEMWWERVELVPDVCNPIVQLLRFVDPNEPGLGKVDYRWFMLERWIKACSGDQDAVAAHDEFITSTYKGVHGPDAVVPEKDLFVPVLDKDFYKDDADGALEFIITRWQYGHCDAIAAVYGFDPEFWAQMREVGETNAEVADGVSAILKKLSRSDEEHDKACSQWIDYQLKQNAFAATNAQMWRKARDKPAHMWCSMEREWSTFEFIHKNKRNRLTIKRATALVSIFSNMQLVRRTARIAARRLSDAAIPWGWISHTEEEEQQLEEHQTAADEGDKEIMTVSDSDN
ncbi:hypothetical protein FOA52_004557 [Chlamydomonas sp. UWO 241]|nr:hypothetical protein FOA52_004557 [Chlamydomonas sp. UWO 241]